MKKYQVITIGGSLQDIMISSNDLKVIKQGVDKFLACAYGAKLQAHEVNLTSGGGAANAAYNLAGLGIKTAIVACLGSDEFGQKSLKDLKSKQVDLTLVQIHSHLLTGFSFILNQPQVNEHTIFVYRGANEYLRLTNDLLSKTKSDWIYLSSLAGRAVEKNLNLIFSANREVAWNPGQAQLELPVKVFEKYLKKTKVLIVNQLEAEALAKDLHLKYSSLQNLVKQLLTLGPKIIAVTCGAQGAHLATDQESFFVPAVKVKTVNSTGAGDAFGSSLLAGLILFKGDLKKAARLAIHQSANVTTQVGAQRGLLTKHQLQKKKLV